MNLRPWILPLFGVLAAAMLYIPGSLILRYENVLKNGEVFKFRTQPVDPYDAFRGRYVALSFDDATTVTLDGVNYAEREKVYATVETKPDGFAHFTGVSRVAPSQDAYLKTQIRWIGRYSGEKDYGYLDIPFDRYYMEESIAPDAETAYWVHSSRKQQDAYATVRVLHGDAVIEELYIADKPIRQYVQEAQKDKKE